MFISAILWTIVACIVVLGIYNLYNRKKDKNEDKEDIY